MSATTPRTAISQTANSEPGNSEPGNSEPANSETSELSQPGNICWQAPPTGTGALSWSNTTAEFGLVEPLRGMYGHATAIADVNDDGWTDLFVGSFADRPEDDYRERGADGPSPDRLLLGGPTGFVNDPSFVGDRARTSGATFADLDDDGDLDLVVARNPRGEGEISARPTTIYERDGEAWTPVATIAADVAGRSVSAVDVDQDGKLDLAIAGDRFGPGPTRLYRNIGDLDFVDATEEWRVPADLDGLALATVDLNGDGWSDIVVSGDERVLLGGPEGFTVDLQPDLEWTLHGDEDDPAGIAVGDLDGDDRPDLVVGHHFNSTIDDGTAVPIRIFLNRSVDGRLALDDVTAEVNAPDLWTKAPHVQIADVDNDGHADIVTSAATAAGTPFVLRNSGGDDLRFDAIGDPGDGTYWVTGAVEDFDHDSRLDIFMVAWEPSSASPLFRGMGSVGHWIAIDLSNAPGAADAVVTIEDGEMTSAMSTAWAHTTTGYAAGSRQAVRFGLGDTTAETVAVELHVESGTQTWQQPVDSAWNPAGC